MILVLLGIIAVGWAFLTFWGYVFGGLIAWRSHQYKTGKRPQKLNISEPPSHVKLLTPPTPYNQETDLAGWDGAEELDVEEEGI